MIPVSVQTEPDDFDVEVRQPGNRFLAICPNPKGDKWKGHDYWRKVNAPLYYSYKGICAYTCEYLPKTMTRATIDHFLPKSVYYNLAYEWSNYRLASQKANYNKGDSIGLVDPFSVKSGWFVLNFPSCMVKPGEGLLPADLSMVQNTIDILRLNADDDYVQGRCDVVLNYVNGDITINFLWMRWPFIAHELTRQGLLDEVKGMFKRFPS